MANPKTPPTVSGFPVPPPAPQLQIVDANGRPTPYFQEWCQLMWLALQGSGGVIDNSTTTLASLAGLAASATTAQVAELSRLAGLFLAYSKSLPDSGVTPGSYTNTNLTVDRRGLILAAANGTGGGGGGGGSGGGGAMSLISSVVTSGSQATVTFSSIPSSFNDLLVVFNGRGTNASDEVVLAMQFNGDTGAHYDFAQGFFGSSATAARNTNQTTANTLQFAGASGGTGYSGNAVLKFPSYTNTLFYKSYSGHGLEETSGQGVRAMSFGGTWQSTAAITSIVFSLNVGAFLDGSVLELYGIGAGTIGTLYPPFTPPVDGSYSWVNQASASKTVNANGSIYLDYGATADGQVHARVLSPGATPYTITTLIVPNIADATNTYCGILFRESGTGKIVTFGPLRSPGQNVVVDNWTNATTFSGTASTQAYLDLATGFCWYQIANDGANLHYRVSKDGYNFVQIFSTAVNTFFTTAPNQVGFFVYGGAGTDTLTLYSWAQT